MALLSVAPSLKYINTVVWYKIIEKKKVIKVSYLNCRYFNSCDCSSLLSIHHSICPRLVYLWYCYCVHYHDILCTRETHLLSVESVNTTGASDSLQAFW